MTFTADDTAHLMGACRMGDDPASSVVDANCRAWDVPNLYVCDGSVFVTSSASNPSLTIQAIAAPRPITWWRPGGGASCEEHMRQKP